MGSCKCYDEKIKNYFDLIGNSMRYLLTHLGIAGGRYWRRTLPRAESEDIYLSGDQEPVRKISFEPRVAASALTTPNHSARSSLRLSSGQLSISFFKQ